VLTADGQALAQLTSLTEPRPFEAVPARRPSARTDGPSDVADAVGTKVRTSAAWSGLAILTGRPIIALLSAQSPLTVCLTWSNTASSDEPLHLWAGRLELAHRFHGSPVPGFTTYFSGSPVVYPPLAAIAVSVGGPVASRPPSLAMVPGTTAALHGITRRLFERRAAFFAAALFGGLSGTQLLGAPATYDAITLALLALATWLAVVSVGRAGRGAAAVRARAIVTGTLSVLLALGVLAGQARLHIDKHVDYGPWFGCAAAGYTVAALFSVVSPVRAATAFSTVVITVALAVLPSVPMASREYRWPGATPLLTSMRHVTAAHPGPILPDDGGDRWHCYLSRQVASVPADGTFYIGCTGPGDTHPRTSLAGYADAIRHGYFSVILPEFVDDLYVDGQVERFVSLSARYRRINFVPHAAPDGPRDYLTSARKGRQ
jgi:hypothetical protein